MVKKSTNDINYGSELKRELDSRHVVMIALGGTIGTGLFLALGESFSTGGPGGALLAYALIGILVYFVMTSLGEMGTFMPVPAAFQTYGSKFVDPSLGFALGWNYWYYVTVSVGAEFLAAAIVMKFWLPDSSTLLWGTVFTILLLGLNLFSVKGYGESEFWFAGIKVITIIVFLICGVLTIFGIMGGKAIGFENWTIEDAPFVGGINGFLGIILVAGFSFQGAEFVGITAGECKNPRTTIPKAIKTVFWRILLFYIGAVIVIGFLIPYTDASLLQSSEGDVAVSPFTLVFERAGLSMAASIMNAVILTSILSCGNSSLYAGTRVLYSMAKEGKAPKVFTKVSKGGVPIIALLFSTFVAMLCYIIAGDGGDNIIYTFLIESVGLAGFISWLFICLCHYRFRKAMTLHGRLDELPYKAKYFPYGPIIAITGCIIIIIFQNIGAFTGDTIDWSEAIMSYVNVIIFTVLYISWKLVKKTKIRKIDEIDLSQGLAVRDN